MLYPHLKSINCTKLGDKEKQNTKEKKLKKKKKWSHLFADSFMHFDDYFNICIHICIFVASLFSATVCQQSCFWVDYRVCKKTAVCELMSAHKKHNSP